MYEEIKEQVYSAFSELIEQARLKKGDLIVFGFYAAAQGKGYFPCRAVL